MATISGFSPSGNGEMENSENEVAAMDGDQAMPPMEKKYKCIFNQCDSKSNTKRNNIERHVWTQHMRERVSMPMEKYIASIHKDHVDRFVATLYEPTHAARKASTPAIYSFPIPPDTSTHSSPQTQGYSHYQCQPTTRYYNKMPPLGVQGVQGVQTYQSREDRTVQNTLTQPQQTHTPTATHSTDSSTTTRQDRDRKFSVTSLMSPPGQHFPVQTGTISASTTPQTHSVRHKNESPMNYKSGKSIEYIDTDTRNLDDTLGKYYQLSQYANANKYNMYTLNTAQRPPTLPIATQSLTGQQQLHDISLDQMHLTKQQHRPKQLQAYNTTTQQHITNPVPSEAGIAQSQPMSTLLPTLNNYSSTTYNTTYQWGPLPAPTSTPLAYPNTTSIDGTVPSMGNANTNMITNVNINANNQSGGINYHNDMLAKNLDQGYINPTMATSPFEQAYANANAAASAASAVAYCQVSSAVPSAVPSAPSLSTYIPNTPNASTMLMMMTPQTLGYDPLSTQTYAQWQAYLSGHHPQQEQPQ